jgi:hypothetical protein
MHMELKALKPRIGNWLTIEELKDFFTTMPDHICQRIPINRKLLEVASEFVEEKNGWWEHPDWEAFLNRLQDEGFHLSEEVKAPIGNILEIFKGYYHNDKFEMVLEKRRKASVQRATHSRRSSGPQKSRPVKEA